MDIIAGLASCLGILISYPAIGNNLVKLGQSLGILQIIIGIIALIRGLIELGNVQGIVATLIGLVLLTGIFYVIPALGRYLEKGGKFLGGFQTIIGIIAIIVGIWSLF